jgi:hypothetical protein
MEPGRFSGLYEKDETRRQQGEEIYTRGPLEVGGEILSAEFQLCEFRARDMISEEAFDM